RPPPTSPLSPYTTLFRSERPRRIMTEDVHHPIDQRLPLRTVLHALHFEEQRVVFGIAVIRGVLPLRLGAALRTVEQEEEVFRIGDRKSTRLNSSHVKISY